MSGRLKNGLLVAAVVALAALPLMIVRQPAIKPDGSRAELFKGSDDQATAAIQKLAPAYTPWFTSIFTSPSTEIDTLLFALQAAVGAGFIGYYIGYARGRGRQQSTRKTDSNRAH